MDTQFWIDRWEKQQTGFHQRDINPYLQRFWPEISQSAPSSKVFVPLCGKSLDMLWLQQQHHKVLGIECSQLAIDEFFATATPEQKQDIRIICGDFFELTSDDVKDCHLVFDRAALIALPEAMRKRYARHLSEILPETVSILLVTLSYPQQQLQGPPFSVSEEEVNALFSEQFRISRLAHSSILDEPSGAGFREKGLTSLDESVYWLKRQAQA